MKKYKFIQYNEEVIKEQIGEQIGGKRKKKKKNIFQYRINNNDNINIDTLDKVVDKQQYYNVEYPLKCPESIFTPTIIPAVRRLVVLGDIHGDFDLFITLLEKAKVIKKIDNGFKWYGGDTYVVQVGDQVDRCRPIGNLTCDNPVTTYKDEASDIKILEFANQMKFQAKQQGGDFISLLGNHELLNAIGQMSYVSHKGIEEFKDYRDNKNKNIVFRDALEARKYAFLPGNEYGTLLGCTRQACVIVGSHLFVHAGIVDGLIEELNMNKNSDLETINIAISKWLLGLLNKDYIDHIINGSRYSMFWTRILGTIPQNVPVEDPICMDNIKKVLKLFKVGHIVVGHTPQSFIFNDKINATCSGSVWRVDNGSSAAFHKMDQNFMDFGQVSKSREPMVLEILNDSIYNVIV